MGVAPLNADTASVRIQYIDDSGSPESVASTEDAEVTEALMDRLGTPLVAWKSAPMVLPRVDGDGAAGFALRVDGVAGARLARAASKRPAPVPAEQELPPNVPAWTRMSPSNQPASS